MATVDASVVTLPARAAPHFPSTDAKHGGFKLTATLSVLEDLLVNAHITDARRHDRKAFELPAACRGALWIAVRGYSDHTLFTQIAEGGGYFLVRLKSSSTPTLTTIRSGASALVRNGPHLLVKTDPAFDSGSGSRFRKAGPAVGRFTSATVSSCHGDGRESWFGDHVRHGSQRLPMVALQPK